MCLSGTGGGPSVRREQKRVRVLSARGQHGRQAAHGQCASRPPARARRAPARARPDPDRGRAEARGARSGTRPSSRPLLPRSGDKTCARSVDDAAKPDVNACCIQHISLPAPRSRQCPLSRLHERHGCAEAGSLSIPSQDSLSEANAISRLALAVTGVWRAHLRATAPREPPTTGARCTVGRSSRWAHPASVSSRRPRPPSSPSRSSQILLA